MALKLPRTIRMDPSDAFVFTEAAEPGEWAVSGTLRFWNRDVTALEGKERQAFRSGLLGVASFGWSTLAIVSEASEAERDAVARLASRIRAELPDAPPLRSVGVGSTPTCSPSSPRRRSTRWSTGSASSSRPTTHRRPPD